MISTRDIEKLRKKFGARPRELHKAQGYSQESLAEECELHRNYIGAVECGEQNTAFSNIVKIAAALKVDPCELFDFSVKRV